MNIRIIATGQEGQHNVLFPQTSFPASGPTAEWLTANGCEEVIPPPYVPTEQDIINSLTWAVQAHLDTTAREKNYDGILSACTYATSTVPQFAAEGQACVEWRDAVWMTCYTVMAEVKAGTRPVPTSDELIAMLPAGPW